MANDNDKMPHSDLVTVLEASERLGKSERTIRRMMSTGKLHTVDISGKNYIQLAGNDALDIPDGTTGKDVILTGKRLDKTDELRDRIESQYRDTIRRLEEENTRLWSMVQSMLPPPAQVPDRTQQAAMPLWIAALIVAAIAIIGGIIWWMNRPTP